MRLVIHNASDLARWFEQEPAPDYGRRQTMLDDRRTTERVLHASELPIDFLIAQPHPEFEEAETFDLDDFLQYH